MLVQATEVSYEMLPMGKMKGRELLLLDVGTSEIAHSTPLFSISPPTVSLCPGLDRHVSSEEQLSQSVLLFPVSAQ